MKNQNLDVGPLELDVLGLLNAQGESSVGNIQTALRQSGKDLAYTTVMTVLVRLHKKRLVERRKDGRQFFYSALTQKNSTAFKIFERVKNSLFRSEKLMPILSLLESEEDLTKEELEELKKAVDMRLKKEKRS